MLAAEVYYRQWSAYTTGGGAYEKNPKRAEQSLEKSEAALARASAYDPTDEPLRMLHAHVLAALHRDEDASREFIACAAIPGTSSTECTRALKLSHNAELGRLEPAPSFKATTMDGQPVSLDALAGKVVLIDFWGSWCHFCVRDSGYVQSMLDSFDPKSFVLLEVDEGDTPDTWSNYVKSNRMQGVQVQDANRQLQSLFHVSGFPTYIILDRDGLIHNRVLRRRRRPPRRHPQARQRTQPPATLPLRQLIPSLPRRFASRNSLSRPECSRLCERAAETLICDCPLHQNHASSRATSLPI